jgi:hypothetical protein
MRARNRRDLISIQLDIRVKVPKGFKLSRAVLDQAVRDWAATGVQPEGFKIKIIDWRRGSKRSTPESAGTSQDQARERLRGLLQAGMFTLKLRKG